ncbi:hypothetical protein JCM6882_004920 [Rhodosporidiobolus microsporus]
MLDRLPHDLVLYLADFVVPAPTSRNLEHRRATCKILSLVHRAWTVVAQKKLDEHVAVFVTDHLTTLALTLGPRYTMHLFAASALRSTLTHLSLSNVALTAAPPPLPHCHTLLLNYACTKTDNAVIHSPRQIISSFPALRIFAGLQCKGTLLDGLVRNLPPTVEHLLTDLLPRSLVQNEALTKVRTRDGKAALRSLTILTAVSCSPFESIVTKEEVSEWLQELRVSCPMPGTQLKSFEPAADCDLEEWSWTVA